MHKIYELMAAAQADVTAIAKDRKNETQNYKFRGVDDVLNMMHGVLSKHQIVCVPTGVELFGRDERTNQKGTVTLFSTYKFSYAFFAPDASRIDACVVGEGGDTADKSSNKAMSAAYKYLMFQTFSIPLEGGLDEGDADHPVAGPKSKPIAKQGPHPETVEDICEFWLKQLGYKTPADNRKRKGQVWSGLRPDQIDDACWQRLQESLRDEAKTKGVELPYLKG